MRQVAQDLRAWLLLDASTPPESTDLAALWHELRETAEPRLREVREEVAQRQCFDRAVRRLQQHLDPLNHEIRQNFPAAEFNQRRKFVDTFFHAWPRHDITNEDVRATLLSGPGANPVRLVIGTAIRTWRDGTVSYQGLYYLGLTETMGGQVDYWESDVASAPCDSIALETGLTALAAEIRRTFPDWLRKFAHELEAKDS